MNPIRVAHIMPFPNVGGTEKATLRLAEAAAHCGFENTIYCPRGACELKHFYHEHAFSTAIYDQVEPSFHHPLPYLRAAQALAQDMKRRHVRIVHCADILGAHYAALAGRLAGAFVLSHVRCQHSSITRRDQTFLYPLQKFVFVSRSTWEAFGMSVPKEKGEVLYDGIPEMDKSEISAADVRAQYGFPGDAPVIGMASRIHPCKDFESLILAARIVDQSFPACRFLIAGDYEQPAHREHYEHLQKMLQEVGLADRFLFTGFLPDMARFFAAIDIFVLSSHAEGLPLVILEAMANRKPVVATNVGGIGEVIEDGRNGLLVPPKSPEDLAQALMTPLRDTQKASDLALAAQRSVQENFGEQPFQKRVRELYCTIAKQQHLSGNYAPCIPM